MCFGFNCLKNSLIFLNVIYVIVGVVMIYASVSGKFYLPYSDNLPVVTGIEICGTFLIGLAVLGLIGAMKHHQVVLFFVSFFSKSRSSEFINKYMIILLILFVVQVIISYASITISNDQLRTIALNSWNSMDSSSKHRFMEDYHCCNFDDEIPLEVSNDAPLCFNILCCKGDIGSQCSCSKCANELINTVSYVFRLAGRLGMFFSFTEIFGVWLTKRYRNQKNPRAHPSAFL